jgi:hypothetical protein
MATYYVKQASDGGSDSANGLTPATAWATVSYALGGTTAITGGDTLYVAPGRYLAVASTSPIGVAPSSAITIIGDVDASEFSGISAGLVRITSHMSGDNAVGLTNRYPIIATSKNNFVWKNIILNGPCNLTSCSYWTFQQCVFHLDFAVNIMTMSECTNMVFDQCLFFGSRIGGSRCIQSSFATQASNFNVAMTIKDCIFYTAGISRHIDIVLSGASAGNPTGMTAYNNTHFGYNTTVYRVTGSANIATVLSVYNTLIFCDTASAHFSAQVSGQLIEDYNRVSGIVRTNTPTGTNTVSTATYYGADFGHYAITRLGQLYPFASHPNSLSAAFGTSTNAPTVDIYGNAWTGVTPDAGAVTYKDISASGGLLTHPGMTGGIRG